MQVALFLIAGLFMGAVPYYRRHVLKLRAPETGSVAEPDVGPKPTPKVRVVIEDIPTADPGDAPDIVHRDQLGRPQRPTSGGSRSPALDPSEVDYMARTLWAEARGESDEGMAAVAHVIMERVGDRRFPSSVQGVVTANNGKYYAYEAWAPSDDPDQGGQRDQLLALPTSDAGYQRAATIARRVMRGDWPNPFPGATHYANTATYGDPWWANPDLQANRSFAARTGQSFRKAKLGRHTFYWGVS